MEGNHARSKRGDGYLVIQAKSVLNVSGYLIATLLLKGRDYSGIQETTSFGKELYYA